MSQTETETESQTTELTLDRATGTLVDSSAVMSTGAGCAVASWATKQKKIDRTTVNDAPAEKQTNSVDLTIVDNNTGATSQITGDATVGLDNPDAVITQKLGTKSLALLLLMNNNTITAENITSQMKESLINGDVATQARILGLDFDSEKFAAAEALLKSITNETRGMKAGRQQFTARTA